MNATSKAKTAILIATDLTSAGSLGICNELIPFAGKHLLQRIIELIVESGYSSIHVFLGDHPEVIRAFMNEGERWGCQIEYHSSGVQEPLSRMVARLKLEPEEQYLLANASVLPTTADFSLMTKADAVILHGQDGTHAWTGWGLLTGAWLNAQNTLLSGLADVVMSDDCLEKITEDQAVSVLTLSDLVKSTGVLIKENLAENAGVKFGRGSQVHSTVQIIAPVYIGQYVKIAAHSVIGPNVSVGDGALIDQAVTMSDSVVMPNSYVGTHLELRDVVVNGPYLANTRMGGSLKLDEAHMLSFVEVPAASRKYPQWLEMMLGGGLKVLLAPLYLLLRKGRNTPASYMIPVWLQHRDKLESRQMAVAPHHAILESGRGALVDHFTQTFYPGLSEVLRGNLDLYGPTIRTVREIEQLPEQWRGLYAQANCGLLQDILLYGPALGMEADELDFASDSYATYHKNIGATFNLVGRYLFGVLKACWASPHRLQQKAGVTMVQ